MTPAAIARPPQLNSLTALRYFAALWVCLLHFSEFGTASSIGANFMHLGFCAVPFFFILSGFVLTYSHNTNRGKISIKEFYWARFARIYPAYAASGLLAFLLTQASAQTRGSGADAGILVYLSVLEAWFFRLPLPINYVGWSITVEGLFYLLFPFIVTRLAELKPKTAAGILVFCLLVLFGLGSYFTWFTHIAPDLGVRDPLTRFAYYFPLNHLPLFVAGCCLVPLFRYTKLQPKASLAILGVCAVTMVALISLYQVSLTPLFRIAIFSPIFVIAIFCFAHLDFSCRRWIVPAGLVLLGEASYSLYIFQLGFHMITHSIFKRFGHANIDTQWFGLILDLILLTGMSLLSYKFFELPARIQLNRLRKYKIQTPAR